MTPTRRLQHPLHLPVDLRGLLKVLLHLVDETDDAGGPETRMKTFLLLNLSNQTTTIFLRFAQPVVQLVVSTWKVTMKLSKVAVPRLLSVRFQILPKIRSSTLLTQICLHQVGSTCLMMSICPTTMFHRK